MKLLEVSGLGVRRSKTFALQVNSLHVAKGQVLCVTGPNGSGKTTMIEALTGLIQPDSGTITIAGRQGVGTNLRATKAVLGFVPDDENWFIKGLSAQEYFALLGDVYKDAGAPGNVLARAAELAKVLRFTALDQLLEQLSHGNKKKVQLIAGLMHSPKVIIIDELRNGLDPLAIIEAEQLIKAEAARGACIVATTHDLWWAQRIADETMLLINGQPVIHQKTAALVKKYGSLEALFLSKVDTKTS